MQGGVVLGATAATHSLLGSGAMAVNGSSPFIGEIIMFGGNFAPAGWAMCNGQLVPISENDALFTLIGTTYGGDGQETFALPNLQSRLPMHQGSSHVIGEAGGTESVTLTTAQLPIHTHQPVANTSGNQTTPNNGVWAGGGAINAFVAADPNGAMANVAGPTGGSQPHDNMVPFLVVTFCISLFGIFPSQT